MSFIQDRDPGDETDAELLVLAVIGPDSPVDLASRPIRIVLADEVDKYPLSAGREGDPLTLVEERAAAPANLHAFRL